jgi:hypothetical protein
MAVAVVCAVLCCWVGWSELCADGRAELTDRPTDRPWNGILFEELEVTKLVKK